MRMHSEMETQGGIHQEEGSWLPRGNRKADRLSRGESHEAGAAEGEDSDQWTQTSGAEAMGLAKRKDDEGAVAYMQKSKMREELQEGKMMFQSIGSRGWLKEVCKQTTIKSCVVASVLAAVALMLHYLSG